MSKTVYYNLIDDNMFYLLTNLEIIYLTNINLYTNIEAK